MKIEIRKTTFDSLFKNILSVRFAETWNQYNTNDYSVNPLVVFETAKWDKLLKLLKEFIDSNKTETMLSDNATKRDLEIGSLIGLYHLINLKRREVA